MFSKKKRLFFFVLMILSLGVEMYVIKTFPPNAVIPIITLEIPIVVIFFIVLFVGIFSLVTLFSKKILQGVLFGVFTNIYLLFRYFGFTKLLYQILLLLIFISIELFFFQKKQEKQ
ncbi:MAG TPA: hypothetical protein VLG12_01970 [Candidatus Saccharimonadales bacterium]|nr:hypothetical protein [Candidatus Saccharimonadales bacterium]